MTQVPDWLLFFERTYPSANVALIRGEHPVLVDTGYGSELAATENLLREAGVPPESLSLIVNTHYHSDHVGGNGGLQRRYETPVAAHRWEAALVNNRDREACSAEWLGQPVEPYEVNIPLSDGDEVDAGGVALEVLHTLGHTLGHISLYAPEEQVFIFEDAVHDDVAWINPYREGAGALERTAESLDRLARLPIRWACSGHGPAIEDPLAVIDGARRRYDKWLSDPQKAAWHGCKRIFSYALMLRDGLDKAEVTDYLLGCPWFQDYAVTASGWSRRSSSSRCSRRCSAPRPPGGEMDAWWSWRRIPRRPRTGRPSPPGRRTGQHHSTGRPRIKESSWPYTKFALEPRFELPN